MLEAHGAPMLDALYGHVDEWPDLKGMFVSPERCQQARTLEQEKSGFMERIRGADRRCEPR